MRTEERISNYERQAEAARKLFLTYDQERILLRYDLAADRQWIFLTYLNVPCRSHLEGGFTLRCLQRLSLPDLATRPWLWQANRSTSGPSIPVLSY